MRHRETKHTTTAAERGRRENVREQRDFAAVVSGVISFVRKIVGMRSYPGIVTRILGEKAIRSPTIRPVTRASFRSLAASTATNHRHVASPAAAVAAAARARTGQGEVGALRQAFGEDGARWGGHCAMAAAAAAVLGADGITDDKVCNPSHQTADA